MLTLALVYVFLFHSNSSNIMIHPKRIIFVGAPASGKGTQANFLSETYGLTTLSTGALLRREMEKGTEIGLQVQAYMNNAQFVPDDLVNEIVRNWILSHQDSAWMLDGYPRTLDQAVALTNFLDKSGVSLDVVVWMNVAKELIEHRILNRKECSACSYMTQEMTDICPKCGSSMKKRNDDTMDAFARRWVDFENLTLPVARFFEERGLVVRVDIDSERPIKQTSDELLQKLSEFFRTH